MRVYNERVEKPSDGRWWRHPASAPGGNSVETLVMWRKLQTNVVLFRLLFFVLLPWWMCVNGEAGWTSIPLEPTTYPRSSGGANRWRMVGIS